MALTLGIDASTQSVTALVFDCAEGKILQKSSVNFGADLPQYKAPQGFIPGGRYGKVHADPRMWLDGLELALGRLRETGAALDKITSICGAGQQHGTVYLNQKGLEQLASLDPGKSLHDQFTGCFSRSTSPIWMDTSTTEQCRAIEEQLGGAMEVCRRTGSIAIERFSGPQIKRFDGHQPLAYVQTARIHLVSSFMASVLSGTDAPIEYGDGAGMNLLNLSTLDWDPELLMATGPGLREKLPPVVPSQTEVGPVAAYFVKRYGISPQAKVVAFTGDNPSSLVGMGATQPGKVVISLGTSDTFFAAMPEPLTDPNGWGHVFGNPLGGFMTLQCFINGSLAREKVRDALGLDWAGFSEAIAGTPAGAEGRRMLPFFGPEISPRMNAEAPLTSGFASDWTGEKASARACVEGQFLNMRLCSEWMQLKPEVIYLTGGASQNDAIAQIVANVFQAGVKRLSVPDSVALGGALRAGLCSGDLDAKVMDAFFEEASSGALVEPDRELAEVYAAAAREIRDLWPA